MGNYGHCLSLLQPKRAKQINLIYTTIWKITCSILALQILKMILPQLYCFDLISIRPVTL